MIQKRIIKLIIAAFLFGVLPNIGFAKACADHLISERNRLFKSLNVSNESILEISAGDIKIITGTGKSDQVRNRSGDYIEVYELDDKQIVLKHIVFSKISDRTWSLTDALYENMGASILVKDDFVWEIRGNDFEPLDCAEKNGFFERLSSSLLTFKRGETSVLNIAKSELYTLILDDPETLFSIKDRIIVETDLLRDKGLQSDIADRRASNSNFETSIELNHRSLGVQKIGVTIPAQELDTAVQTGDESALFYLSDFHGQSQEATKSAFLRFNLGVTLQDASQTLLQTDVYAALGGNVFVQSGLSLSTDKLSSKKLALDQMLIGAEIDSGALGFARFRVGQFDAQNQGFLVSAYKPARSSEKLFSLQAYFSSDQSCDQCTQTAISMSVQEFRPRFGGYWTTSVDWVKSQGRYDKSTHFMFEKPILNGARIFFTGTYDLSPDNDHGFSFGAHFPIAYSKSNKAPIYFDSSIQARKGRYVPLRDWSQMDRDIYISNSKNTLERNWKSYMDLDF